MRYSPPSARLLAICLCLTAVTVLAACSSGDDDGGDNEGGSPVNVQPSIAGPQPQPYPAQPLGTEQTQSAQGVIEISASGSLFAQNNLAVQVGESVILRVTNGDSTPHNLRLAGIDGVFDTEDDAVTVPDSIENVQVGELTFAPPADGFYTFRCDFHPTTMGGMITAGQPAGPAPTPDPSPSPSPTESPVEESEGG